jgi:hypothetical protein
MTDTKKLREAAERAIKHNWYAYARGYGADFIEIACPTAVLSLLDELDALRAENNRLAFERDLARRDKARAETERNEMEQRLSNAKV